MGNTVKVTLESFRGPAGYSPTIQTVETDAGLELTIADVSGTKTVTIRHGAKRVRRAKEGNPAQG